MRVGDWGGHLLVDCDDPLMVHKFCSMLPAFTMEARPVIPVADAVRAELEVMAWRNGPDQQVTSTMATAPLKPTHGLSGPPALVQLSCLSSSGLIGSRYEHGRTRISG